MNTRDKMFIVYIDDLRWAFAAESREMLEALISAFPRLYDKKLISVEHYVALMNCGKTYLKILKEGKEID